MDTRQNKGLALLISVLVISVVLAVGLSLVSFVIKQVKISSAARDSVIAVYAADAGVECALLWDIRGELLLTERVFPRPSDTGNPASAVPCFGNDIVANGFISPAGSWDVDTSVTDEVTTTFQLQFAGAPTYCAIVSVTKDDSGPRLATTILSRGYNAACSQILGGAQVVERAIRVDYVFN